jgi:phosphoserine phosphatase RsbU/P
MIKIPQLNIGKVSVLMAVLIWLSLLFIDITRVFGVLNQVETPIAIEISLFLQIIFFVFVYLFYNYSITHHQSNNFIDLIWRGASTGLLATAVSLFIYLFYMMMGESRLASDPLLINFFYHVNFAFVSLFLISCTLLWKHLILYQKSKRIVKQWQAFEVLLLISMFFNFFNKNTLDYSFLFGLLFLSFYAISLSVNLKWIPYLTFKEKWKSLLFLFIIILSTVYLFFQLLSYSESNFIIVNLTDNLFLLSLITFVFVYSLFSFLVTLFNLPTSSVFEQKLIEAINFQRLSQSIKPGESENEVLDILVESCMSAAYVDACWLELKKEGNSTVIIHQKFIEEPERINVQHLISQQLSNLEVNRKRGDQHANFYNGKLNHELYRSLMVLPLEVNKEVFGKLFLLKEVKEGFNKEMVNILQTFVGQACISVENYRLLNEALQNERYKEELKIAQRVQRSLLPSVLHHDQSFEICGISEAADEVGGDYYETQPLDEHRFAIIIGDVSGKGTSAAFNMSQMKGIFHTLVQLNPSPSEFLIKANMALSKCLEKNHFITTTFYILDTLNKRINYSRAGHCPTLYYHAKDSNCEYLSIEGMGLGILRSKLYEKYVHENTIHYQPGDIMVMFTDGIVEAKNEKGVEYGYERLKTVLKENTQLSVDNLQQQIIESVYGFIGHSKIPDDDYSLLIIRFNE